jgi:hypothetical protein
MTGTCIFFRRKRIIWKMGINDFYTRFWKKATSFCGLGEDRAVIIKENAWEKKEVGGSKEV